MHCRNGHHNCVVIATEEVILWWSGWAMFGINLKVLVAMVTELCTHSISAMVWSACHAPAICILHTSAKFKKTKDTIFLKQIIFLKSFTVVLITILLKNINMFWRNNGAKYRFLCIAIANTQMSIVKSMVILKATLQSFISPRMKKNVWKKAVCVWESASSTIVYLSLVTRKPVFGVCDQVRFKPGCSASETS